MPIDFSQRNYPSLILAGLGVVGQGILRLGEFVLRSFDQIVLADLKEERCIRESARTGQTVFCGDIAEDSFLDRLLEEVRTPALFVNVCSHLDTVRLRRFLSNYAIGYVDVCASAMESEPLSRFSRLMPYTNTACHVRFPHLICQGINPGLVEYAVRLLLETFGPEEECLVVSIFENDQLYSPGLQEKAAVGWSPEDLAEEVLVSPSMEISDREIREDDGPGTREVPVFWRGIEHPARLVGHEDIWNLGQLDRVGGAHFLYTLHPEVMKIFRESSMECLDRLAVPEPDAPLEGMESIVVKVGSPGGGHQKALLWQADHEQIQRQHGINAVQYQAGLGTLLAMALLQYTQAGRLEGTYNASTLPLTSAERDGLVFLMRRMGIHWRSIPPETVACPGEL